MKRLLLDTNVVLDAMLERPPHSAAASKLWAAAETRRAVCLVPAHGVTTLFYLLARAKGASFARGVVASVLRVFSIAPVDQGVLQRALGLGWPDFEDAVCAAAAETAGCDAIVTGDPKRFAGCPLAVLSPTGGVALLEGPPAGRVSEGTPRYRRRRRAARRSGAHGL